MNTDTTHEPMTHGELQTIRLRNGWFEYGHERNAHDCVACLLDEIEYLRAEVQQLVADRKRNSPSPTERRRAT